MRSADGAAGHDVEVAIVGGGPAGAALAIRLAERRRSVAVFERLPRPRWRASGVYSSPLTRRCLAALGLSEQQLERLIRPISAMVVATADGRATCRLEYPAPNHACGVDRVRLEEALLDRARAAGAQVHVGAVVRQVHLTGVPGAPAGLLVSRSDGPAWWTARLVVGADGPSSIVARSAGVALTARRYRQAAVTGHRLDPAAGAGSEAMEARLIVGPGWYLGLAPVPGGRVNLGLVLGEADLREGLLRAGGLDGVMNRALTAGAGLAGELAAAPASDELDAHLPLLHRVSAAAGPGFMLVGDACGFVDPISGEGLHRALVSAELAARAIVAGATDADTVGRDYHHRLRARFGGKDVLSWLLQVFVHQPWLTRRAMHRLERRPELSRRLARALADMAPASDVVNPRFVAALIGP